MLTVHFVDTDAYEFTSGDREVINHVSERVEPELRSLLPCLPGRIHLLVEPGEGVIAETGEVGFTYAQWKFEHADGRRWIAYRVGTYLARKAISASGRSAADLVWEPVESLMSMAGIEYRRPYTST